MHICPHCLIEFIEQARGACMLCWQLQWMSVHMGLGNLKALLPTPRKENPDARPMA